MSDRERSGGSAGGEPRGGSHPRDGDPSGAFFRELSIPLLAHELKGPLAVIEAGVSTALERAADGTDPARLARTLRRVLRSTRRAQALVDDLLEVGRAEAGELELRSFDPTETLIEAIIDAVEAMDAELAERLAERTDASAARATATLAAGGVVVAISDRARATVLEQDARKFSLIAANLVRNALRFRRSRVEVVLEVGERTARLTVEDDGPGVALEDRQRIFERWTRVADESGSRQGHGLGLAAARILARGMGGDVTLVEGTGSRFELEIPIAAPK
jgi:signal transduction histidine kinase